MLLTFFLVHYVALVRTRGNALCGCLAVVEVVLVVSLLAGCTVLESNIIWIKL